MYTNTLSTNPFRNGHMFYGNYVSVNLMQLQRVLNGQFRILYESFRAAQAKLSGLRLAEGCENFKQN